MPREFIGERRDDFDGTLIHLRTELNAFRTGRANPAILDAIQVEAYGTMNPLNAIASISVPDARTIVIEPWDKAVVKDIEKAITEAKIGVNPVVAGTVIRLPLPALTEEGRKELVKSVGEKLEAARIHIRRIRDEVRHEITEAEKAKDISEDEKYRMHDDLDKVAAGWNEKIKEFGEAKEKEIMTI